AHLRHQARRALRRGHPGARALLLALSGILASPAGFFSRPGRALSTLGGALVAPLLPLGLRRSLFAA
ncbi:glycosyltransferase family 2 protein, partial [Mangrovicoccus sp. HB182678]|nr:glycosyltransferase family 2 protein [Mangrovicoccus algicola]